MDGSFLSPSQPARAAQGRFAPGVSGNPAGKPKGARNRATVLAELLAAEDGGAVARVVIDQALSGDVATARFLLGLIVPKPRARTIELDLPVCATLADVSQSFTVTLAAMAAREITPDEALTVAKVLERRQRSLEARRGRRDAAIADAAASEEDPVAALAAGDITPAEALAASPKPARQRRARPIAAAAPATAPASDLNSTCIRDAALASEAVPAPAALAIPPAATAALGLNSTCISRPAAVAPPAFTAAMADVAAALGLTSAGVSRPALLAGTAAAAFAVPSDLYPACIYRGDGATHHRRCA